MPKFEPARDDAVAERPRWRFRLRTLLGFITVICIALAAWTQSLKPMRDEASAKSHITSAGGAYYAETHVPRLLRFFGADETSSLSQRIAAIDMRGQFENRRSIESHYHRLWRNIAGLEWLRWLDARFEQVSDSELDDICQASRLEYLNLAGTLITKKGVSGTQFPATLRWLVLPASAVGEDDLARIRHANPRLQLHLSSSTGFPPDCPDGLQGLWRRRQPVPGALLTSQEFGDTLPKDSKSPFGPQLALLSVGGYNDLPAGSKTFYLDVALDVLRSFPDAAMLDLEGLPMGDERMERLEGLNRVVLLRTVGCGVSAKGIAMLQALPSLTHLCIPDSLACGDGLESLLLLRQLNWLGVEGNSLSAVEKRDLTSRLKGVEVTFCPAVAPPHVRLGHVRSRWNGPKWMETFQPFDSLYRYRDIVEVTLNRSASDQSMRSLSSIATLQSVTCDGCTLSKTGLEPLAGLPELCELSLLNVRIPLSALHALGQLKRLRRLQLNVSITATGESPGAGMSPWDVSSLHELEELGVSCKAFQDADLQSLRTLPKLRRLSLAGTSITDAAISLLQKLSTLEAVDLSNTRVTREAAAQLESNAKLKEVIY